MPDAYVYLIDDLPTLPTTYLADNFDRLPLFRREQCLRYRHDSDRLTCLLAYELLCQGLDAAYGLAPPQAFEYSDSSKPYLPGTPGVFFSISHCAAVVACAIGDSELGIDVQDVRPYDSEVAKRACTQDELTRLAAAPDPGRLFCRLWADKESYAKAHGISVATVLAQVLPNGHIVGWDRGHYHMSLCFRDRIASTCAVDVVNLTEYLVTG